MGNCSQARRTSRIRAARPRLSLMKRSPFHPPGTTALATVCVSLRWALALALVCGPSAISAQQDSLSGSSHLTPQQFEIETQRRRLLSSETEDRRDAVMRLGAMRRPEGSRVAAIALKDRSQIVRATAARAVLSLPKDEGATLLLPLLRDREAFVRQEAAYALGENRSRTAVAALSAILEREKDDGVRGAAAVALGQIGDEHAVMALAPLLSRRVPASGLISRVRRSKKDENEFVRRAATRSLGQIGNRAAVPALAAVLLDETAPDDVRREAMTSLAIIGDVSAVPALRRVLSSRDPYLARSAWEALLKIAPEERVQPTRMN